MFDDDLDDDEWPSSSNILHKAVLSKKFSDNNILTDLLLDTNEAILVKKINREKYVILNDLMELRTIIKNIEKMKYKSLNSFLENTKEK